MRVTRMHPTEWVGTGALCRAPPRCIACTLLQRPRPADDPHRPLQAVTNPSVAYPSYYTQPFHAYSQVRPAQRACELRPGQLLLARGACAEGARRSPPRPGSPRAARRCTAAGYRCTAAVWRQRHLPARPPAPACLRCQGNLCWDAALEVTLAAQSVHAAVMDPAGKTMDPRCGRGWRGLGREGGGAGEGEGTAREATLGLFFRLRPPRASPMRPAPLPAHAPPCPPLLLSGDAQLRASYSARLLECLGELGVAAEGLCHAVDLGCATGGHPRGGLGALRGRDGARKGGGSALLSRTRCLSVSAKPVPINPSAHQPDLPAPLCPSPAGLSSLELLRALGPVSCGPLAVTGVDLSPHFLAVAAYQQEQRQVGGGRGGGAAAAEERQGRRSGGEGAEGAEGAEAALTQPRTHRAHTSSPSPPRSPRRPRAAAPPSRLPSATRPRRPRACRMAARTWCRCAWCATSCRRAPRGPSLRRRTACCGRVGRAGAHGGGRGWGASFLMREACPGVRSYVGLLRAAGAKAARLGGAGGRLLYCVTAG
jgi:hypothetical protein